jgi:hypothetical protein
VAANLAFLAPAVAAGCAFTALLARRARFWTVVDRFWGPALVPAFLILVLPLTHAEAANFYYGAQSIAGMEQSLAGGGLAIRFLVPPLALLILAGAATAAVRYSRAPALLLLGATMTLTLAALVVAHAWFGVLYPMGRTGIYWPPLFSLAGVLTTAWLWRAKLPGKVAAAALGAVLVLSVGLFAAGFRTGQIPEWRYDAGTKRIVGLLRARHAAEPARRVRLGVTWLLEPSLNFYRQMYDLKWLAPVTRAGPDGDYDYYVTLPQDDAVVKRRALQPIYKDPVSEATLAAPKGDRRI